MPPETSFGMDPLLESLEEEDQQVETLEEEDAGGVAAAYLPLPVQSATL